MKKSQRRDAVRCEKFYFRKDILSGEWCRQISEPRSVHRRVKQSILAESCSKDDFAIQNSHILGHETWSTAVEIFYWPEDYPLGRAKLGDSPTQADTPRPALGPPSRIIVPEPPKPAKGPLTTLSRHWLITWPGARDRVARLFCALVSPHTISRWNSFQRILSVLRFSESSPPVAEQCCAVCKDCDKEYTEMSVNEIINGKVCNCAQFRLSWLCRKTPCMAHCSTAHFSISGRRISWIRSSDKGIPEWHWWRGYWYILHYSAVPQLHQQTSFR